MANQPRTVKSKRTVVKQVPFCKLWSDGTLTIQNVRWSYPHVFKPYGGTMPDGTQASPSYSLVALLPKDTHRQAKDLIKERSDQILLQATPAGKPTLKLPPDKKFMRDGDDSDKEGYAGCWTVHTREARQPTVKGPRKEVLNEEQHGRLIFGGVFGDILIRPWWQGNKWGKRVNAGLVAVQYVRTGEAFGEGRISDEQVDESFDDYQPGADSGFDPDLDEGGAAADEL